MAMSYKARRRWSLVILLVGLPIYILVATVLATTVVGWLGQSPLVFLVQLANDDHRSQFGNNDACGCWISN